VQHVLTICTGNICRSPVAEAALRDACHGIDPDSAAAAQAMVIAEGRADGI
jgi:protein-tyrosine-phosphatase